ncbi:deaminase domain-containing protein [Paenibacillus aquistagni]|uniref:deaminase domain-containing protein n=1 Tax=Paenibacillus aquistagni TaxID=1852522 RepID=UPI001C6FCC7F|nr:deaminase domain-containing protein [Paenibacillus aquistagni]
MGFTKGLLTGIIEGIVDTAGLAYQLVVDPQQVGKDMLYAAEYLIQNRELVVEAAKQMYANFESASPEEKAEMVGKVSSILVPGMGVTKAGKAAKVPEALSSMTQAVKTSKVMNVLANPIKRFKEIDWKSYTIRFQDWVQSLKSGRFAVTPDGMLVRIPDETSSVVRRIDAGDGKKIEGMGNLSYAQKVEMFHERTQAIRDSLPNKYKNYGNVAVADVNIPGLKTEFKAHSRIHKENADGFSSVTGEGQFPAKSVNQKGEVDGEGAFPRDNDTERKILEDIANQLGNNKQTRGKIDLFTELPACRSCSDIIMKFRQEYPNIKLNVYSGEFKN